MDIADGVRVQIELRSKLPEALVGFTAREEVVEILAVLTTPDEVDKPVVNTALDLRDNRLPDCSGDAHEEFPRLQRYALRLSQSRKSLGRVFEVTLARCHVGDADPSVLTLFVEEDRIIDRSRRRASPNQAHPIN